MKQPFSCKALALAICLALWGAHASAQAQENQVLPNPKLLTAELLARGKVVYRNHCAGCHGEKGDGNGPGAYGLNPKPRDFTSGVFKFRSTPSGSLPTDEDLFRTIRQGIPGTSMPAFDLMAERDVLAVALYLKVFSPEWLKAENYAAPVPIPPPPEWFNKPEDFQKHAQQGKELFAAACAACHGEKADGKGLAAEALADNWGNQIRPADLRRPHIRSGRNLTDVYKAMVTGISGTPMPAFKDALSDEQLWELVAYVAQLRREKSGKLAASTPAPQAASPKAEPSPKPAAPSESSQYE